MVSQRNWIHKWKYHFIRSVHGFGAFELGELKFAFGYWIVAGDSYVMYQVDQSQMENTQFQLWIVFQKFNFDFRYCIICHPSLIGWKFICFPLSIERTANIEHEQETVFIWWNVLSNHFHIRVHSRLCDFHQ